MTREHIGLGDAGQPYGEIEAGDIVSWDAERRWSAFIGELKAAACSNQEVVIEAAELLRVLDAAPMVAIEGLKRLRDKTVPLADELSTLLPGEGQELDISADDILRLNQVQKSLLNIFDDADGEVAKLINDIELFQ